MSAADCRHARLHIGAAPQELPAEIAQHLAGCAECSRFRDETLSLDARLRRAPKCRCRGSRARTARALAGTGGFGGVGAALAGGARLLNWPALAGEIASTSPRRPVAGTSSRCCHLPISTRSCGRRVRFDSSLPVVYAMVCPFHGRHVPHFVVQTPDGPMTVMLLAHEKVSARTEFRNRASRRVAACRRGQRRRVDAQWRGADEVA